MSPPDPAAPSRAANSTRGSIEGGIESIIFASRWLLAPLYLGMVGAIVMVGIKFFQEFAHYLPNVMGMETTILTNAVLELIDLVLTANLLLIFLFSGYENFISKINAAIHHKDRPAWMGTVDYGGLKLKVIGSIIAITSVQLLKAFVNIKAYTREELIWLAVLHLVFLASGVAFSVMERMAAHCAAHER
jgi:uncharacterized protein (TIGR00645 family)